MKCRHCQAPLNARFVDLGDAPPSNAYLTATQLAAPEPYYPLKVDVCTQCWLVQTEDFVRADAMFDADYAYFSSTSKSWVEHAKRYCAMITTRLKLSVQSHVVELASNDGYLLQYFLAAGIPCLGIEPTNSTAAAAEALGIPVLRAFFGDAMAATLPLADLIIGNNVYAHVPDINDFTRGMARLLKPQGTITLEFPHVMELIAHGQFDTIYHEHFSYLSLTSVRHIFASCGLRVYDVEQLPTHGGSLRVYGCHHDAALETSQHVAALLAQETVQGLTTLASYQTFQARAETTRDGLLAFLEECRRDGKKVAAYGAAAKGNTLLNFASVKANAITCVYDAAASKQGKFMPGSRIPIVDPARMRDDKPDVLLILPWNIAAEVTAQHGYAKAWGCAFVVAVPTIRTL